MRLRFWIPWTIDVLAGALILFYFFSGLVTGSVSSFNIGIWIVILAALAIVLGGSLLLRSIGRPGLGLVLLMVLAVPAVLCVIFLLIVVLSDTPWN